MVTTGRAMGSVLEWKTGGGLRASAREDARYAFPAGLHIGAALVALASPILAILILLSSALTAA